MAQNVEGVCVCVGGGGGGAFCFLQIVGTEKHEQTM